MTTGQLLSIQVGRPRLLDDPFKPGHQWRTGFIKDPVPGPVRVLPNALEGDGQADKKHHGGSDKAILAYSAEHYALWQSELAKPDLTFGGFAENLSVHGFDEDTVCIGDTFAIGEVRLQVSQPRQPCVNIAKRWAIADLTKRVGDTGRTGWYLRVLNEGFIEAGQPVELVERLHPEWTVTRATQTMLRRHRDPAAAAELGGLPEISKSWRDSLSPAD